MGGKVLLNGTTSVSKSVPRLVVDKVRLMPVIQMFSLLQIVPNKYFITFIKSVNYITCNIIEFNKVLDVKLLISFIIKDYAISLTNNIVYIC